MKDESGLFLLHLIDLALSVKISILKLRYPLAPKQRSSIFQRAVFATAFTVTSVTGVTNKVIVALYLLIWDKHFSPLAMLVDLLAKVEERPYAQAAVFVRVYEERMDLLGAIIIGTPGTPYHDGLFFFDIVSHLPILMYHREFKGFDDDYVIFYIKYSSLKLIQYRKGQHAICADHKVLDRHLKDAGRGGLEDDVNKLIWTPYKEQG
ncbi:hypothetical protein IFM89_001022 [Coptis chinensis]|uniref:Uncharacterized protein n=1 Tax=Coptis chinensis TaxID=261450 RepID=A0A835GWL3_9MAGN|nr:hypothetical protein IFM89_001022 [Coptis chinensis]